MLFASARLSPIRHCTPAPLVETGIGTVSAWLACYFTSGFGGVFSGAGGLSKKPCARDYSVKGNGEEEEGEGRREELHDRVRKMVDQLEDRNGSWTCVGTKNEYNGAG